MIYVYTVQYCINVLYIYESEDYDFQLQFFKAKIKLFFCKSTNTTPLPSWDRGSKQLFTRVQYSISISKISNMSEFPMV